MTRDDEFADAIRDALKAEDQGSSVEWLNHLLDALAAGGPCPKPAPTHRAFLVVAERTALPGVLALLTATDPKATYISPSWAAEPLTQPPPPAIPGPLRFELRDLVKQYKGIVGFGAAD